jgi:hypothetical protein
MSDITVVVADSTPQNVVISSSTPDITEVINVGPPGADGSSGNSFDQSLNTTDSPTFVAVNTASGTLTGGVYPGFFADGHGFEMTHGDQNQGTIDVFAPSLSGDQSVSVTLPSASGTLALNNQPGINIVAASVSLSDPEGQVDYTGGISLGFTGSKNGVLFNGAGDGSYYLTHKDLLGQDYTISLPSASGTLALTTGSSPIQINDLGTTNNGESLTVSTNGVFISLDNGATTTTYLAGAITNVVDSNPNIIYLPAASGTLALTSDIPTLESLGGQAFGNYATLVGGLIPASQLPSYVDDVLEYQAISNFPTPGEVGKIYVSKGSGLIYRWTGTMYVEISPSTAQVQSDWNATSGLGQILNKPTLFSGSYADLTSKPTLFSGSYADLTSKPTLFSGSYADLTSKPTLFSGVYTDLTSKPTLGTVSSLDVAATGDASASQVVKGSDTRLTNARTPSSTLAHASSHASGGSDALTLAASQITGLATVATSGAYSALSGTPSLASVATSGSASDLATGTLPDARLSTNVVTLTGTQTLTNKSISAGQITGLATVATSGAYSALSGTPSLASVATSGSYTDLTNLPVIAKKSTADVNSTNTTLADVTGLTNFVLEANTMYRFEFAGRHTCVSGGSQYLVLNSTQAIANASAQGWYVIFGSRTDAGFSNPSGNLYAFINRSSTGNTNNPSAAVYYIMTGSSAPTMKIQFSQTGTATGTATLLSGAVAVFTKLI